MVTKLTFNDSNTNKMYGNNNILSSSLKSLSPKKLFYSRIEYSTLKWFRINFSILELTNYHFTVALHPLHLILKYFYLEWLLSRALASFNTSDINIFYL